MAQADAAAAAARADAGRSDSTEASAGPTALDDQRDARRVRVAELTTTLEHLARPGAELEEQVAPPAATIRQLAAAVDELDAA